MGRWPRGTTLHLRSVFSAGVRNATLLQSLEETLSTTGLAYFPVAIDGFARTWPDFAQSKTPESGPMDRAWVIYQTACQVVAEQFHVRRPSDLQVPLKLNIGDGDAGFRYDSGSGRYEINLTTWNENSFAFAALRLALQRVTALQKGRDLLRDTLKRSERKLLLNASRRR